MFVISYTNISCFIEFLIDTKYDSRKKLKIYFLICNTVLDEVTNFEVCRFMENKKIRIS